MTQTKLIPHTAHARMRNEHGELCARLNKLDEMLEAGKLNPQAPKAFLEMLEERRPMLEQYLAMLERQMASAGVTPAKAFKIFKMEQLQNEPEQGIL